MVDLPSIDLPTAIAATILAVGGNWAKDELLRYRDKIREKKDKKIEWYKQAITLCEEVKFSPYSGINCESKT